MSNSAIIWAAPIAIKGAKKAVLLALAISADEDGRCELRQSDIALHAGCTERSVRYAIEQLAAGGFVRLDPLNVRAYWLVMADAPKTVARSITARPRVAKAATIAGKAATIAGFSAAGIDAPEVPPPPPLPAPFRPPPFRPRPPLSTPHISPPITPTHPGAREPPAMALVAVPTGKPRQRPSLTKSARAEETPAFAAFWAAYPRKLEGPGAARTAWQSAIGKADPAVILDGLARYPFSDEPRYWPQATTWLNQERWRTEASTPPPQTSLFTADPVSAMSDFLRRVAAGEATIDERAPAHGEPPDYLDAAPGDWHED